VGTQPPADAARLVAAAVVEVPLGGTVADLKVRWIPGTGCQGVADHQDVAVGWDWRVQFIGCSGSTCRNQTQQSRRGRQR
jgi:hypothetical protein